MVTVTTEQNQLIETGTRGNSRMPVSPESEVPVLFRQHRAFVIRAKYEIEQFEFEFMKGEKTSES